MSVPPGNSSAASGVRDGGLAALLARAEAAAGPDQELECLIHVALGIMPVITAWPPRLGKDWTWELRVSEDRTRVETWASHPTDKWSPSVLYGRYPEPVTASLDAALALVERVLPQAYVELSEQMGNPDIRANRCWIGTVTNYLPDGEGWRFGGCHEVTGKTAPLAVLAAALKALDSAAADTSARSDLAREESK